jgi:hypothetical protein
MNVENLNFEVFMECLAPLFAILLEAKPFPGDRQIKKEAKEFIANEQISGNHASTHLERFTKGTLSLASVVPTFIAMIATIATFHDIRSILLVVTAVLFGIFMLNALVGGRTLDGLNDDAVISFFGREHIFNGFPWTKLISWSIRFVNLGLVIAILAHALWLPETTTHKTETPEHSTGSRVNEPTPLPKDTSQSVP